MPISTQQLLQILPNAGQSAGVFVSAPNTAMNHYQIVGLKRVATFIAQIGHESGQLKYVKEIWGPTKAQARYEGRADLGKQGVEHSGGCRQLQQNHSAHQWWPEWRD